MYCTPLEVYSKDCNQRNVIILRGRYRGITEDGLIHSKGVQGVQYRNKQRRSVTDPSCLLIIDILPVPRPQIAKVVEYKVNLLGPVRDGVINDELRGVSRGANW